MSLSLCIVGCGQYAATVLGDTEDVRGNFDLYFASRDIDKAKDYADRFGGVGYFGSYEAAATSPDVDAMYFLTPHNLHLDNALMAAANSKHILVEKPISRTLDEARRMRDSAREANVKLMVAEDYRFLPAVLRAKDLVASGEIGDLRSIVVTGDWEGARSGWRSSRETSGGGVFIDAGIHFVDLLVNLAGMPESLYAAALPQTLGKEAEDVMAVVAHLSGGTVGTINLSKQPRRIGRNNQVVVSGTDATLTFGTCEPYTDSIEKESLHGKYLVPAHGPSGSSNVLMEFRSCILEDREPLMDADEAINDLAVVLAAYESVETGEPVKLS
jgi:predicted dehydrogenase